MLQEVDRKLQQLIGAFSEILYEDDEIFMENMRRKRTFLRKNCKNTRTGNGHRE